MTVFRTYLALLRKYWLIILSYTAIFILLAAFQGGSAASGGPVFFERGSMNAALSIPTGGQAAGDAFGQWLEEEGHQVTYASFTLEEAREAVFDHGFDAVFLYEPDQAIPQAVIDQSSGNGYFAYSVAATYFRYLDAFGGHDGSGDDSLLHQVLAQEMEVVIQESKDGGGRGDSSRIAFFSGFAYVLLLMSTTLVPLVSQSFSEPGLSARTALSPYPVSSQAAGMMLGSSLIVFGTAAVLLLATLPLTLDYLGGGQTLLHMVNLLVFALSVLALSYLVTNLVRSKVAITAVSTVLSLGMAFLSGAFVPQSLLGDTALTIARAFPLYYYIHANLRADSLSAMGTDLLIQLCFAVVYFAAAMVAVRLARRARGQTAV